MNTEGDIKEREGNESQLAEEMTGHVLVDEGGWLFPCWLWVGFDEESNE